MHFKIVIAGGGGGTIFICYYFLGGGGSFDTPHFSEPPREVINDRSLEQ